MGLLLASIAVVGCGSSPEPVSDLPASSTAAPSLPNFSTYVACGPLDYAQTLENVLQNYLDGTAAQQDLAEPLSMLGSSLRVADNGLASEVEGWTPEAVASYQALSEEVKRFRVRLLDGPRLTEAEIEIEIESFTSAIRDGAPTACEELQ